LSQQKSQSGRTPALRGRAFSFAFVPEIFLSGHLSGGLPLI
jgi:hypothetical protein